MPAEPRTTSSFEHEVRGRLTVVVGEIELVLARSDVTAAERRASADRALEAVLAVEELLTAPASAPGSDRR